VRVPQFVFKAALAVLALVKEVILAIGGTKVDSAFARFGKWYLAKKSDVDQFLVLFVTSQNDFTCNPKYIALELLRRNTNLKLVWAISDQTKGPFPQEMDFVMFGSSDFYRRAAEAKVVIVNNHALQIHRAFKNPMEQYWIQTWHGSLGFKKLEGAGGLPRLYKKIKALDISQTDFIISNSQFEDDVYSSTYWPGVPSKRLGHARNDILFDESKETKDSVRRKVLSRLGIQDSGQNFVLFAPTHDDTNPHQSFGHVDFPRLKATLTHKFGGVWEVLMRTHERNRSLTDSWLSGLPNYCHNASAYPDIQELLVVSDVGLTDYSSWILDYLITQKPGFLIGSNIAQYELSRGFYHDFADTPFDLATNNEQLFANIQSFDQSSYETRIKNFFEVCGLMDDGLSSSRVVDFILELVERSAKGD